MIQATPTKCNVFRPLPFTGYIRKVVCSFTRISKSYAVNLVVLVILFSNAFINTLRNWNIKQSVQKEGNSFLMDSFNQLNTTMDESIKVLFSYMSQLFSSIFKLIRIVLWWLISDMVLTNTGVIIGGYI